MHYSSEINSLTPENPLRIIIVGGGIAGVAAAEAARKQNADCAITILSAELHLPYHRVRVADLLRDEQLAERLTLHPESWYEERRIDILLNVSVTDIRIQSKEIVLSSGQTMPYDKLILAAGSRSYIPPVKGSEHPAVHSLWTMHDALELGQQLNGDKRAVVIGGGLLGLETAWQLRNRGCKVTVVEFLPRLLAKQLTEEASRIFLERVESRDIEIMTSASAVSIDADPENPSQIRGVTLQDGRFLAADLVVISAGVRANTELAEQAGLEIGIRIKVNDRMETSGTDIYAAGDATELQDGSWHGLWMVAQQEGHTAGMNAAGGSSTLILKTSPYMLNSIDTRLISAGLVQGPELEHMIIEEETDLEKLTYKYKVFDSEHHLKGFILLGDVAEQGRLLQQISV